MVLFRVISEVHMSKRSKKPSAPSFTQKADGQSSAQNAPVRGHLIALEPRMMFDGAAVVTAGAIVSSSDALAGDANFSDPFPLHRFISVGDDPLLMDGDRDIAFFRMGPAPIWGAAAAPTSATRDVPVNVDTGADTNGFNDPALTRDWGVVGSASQRGDAAALNPEAPYRPNGVIRDNFFREFDAFRLRSDEASADLSVPAAVDPAAIDAAAPANIFIFIDTNVTGYDQLAAEWHGRGTIILIDGSRDGIDQIRTALIGITNVDAIHIVSHGGEGYFNLGTTRIDQASITGELSSSLASIGSRLNTDGDLLIYGCDVGATAAGQRLIDSLALATGADIAASVNETGSILRGGDWTLENRLGVIDNATLTSQLWEGLLAPAALTGTNGGLTLRDSTGAVIAFTAGQSAAVGAGAVARWTNVATIGGVQVDLVATVGTLTNASGVRFNQSGTNGTLNDDFGILLQTTAGTGNATAVVTWSIVRTGTNTPFQTDITFTVADIDGVSATQRREFVSVSTNTLSSFQAAGTSRVQFDPSVAGLVTAYGTADESGAAESGARFNWLNTSSFQVTYNLARNVTVGGNAVVNALFNHDGDLDFDFGTGGVTTSIPRLDLDGNDNTAPGSAFVNSFTENGPAVRIVDTDVSIVNPVGNVTSATITLTNAQANDQFLINGTTATTGTLTGGISYTISGNIIQLTGSANANQYQNALQAITFQNTSEAPTAGDRTINLSFGNGTFNSNVAVSTISVIAVNDTPTISAPASYTGTEDTAVTINGLTMADVDAGTSSVQLTISVPAGVGVLNFTPTAFITVVNNGTGTVTLQGQRSAILNAVNGGALTLNPAANFNGTSSVSFVFNDRGNAGRDPGLTGDATSEEATVTATLTLAAVNDAPVAVGNLLPRSNVDAASGISVATASGFTDVDNATLTYSAAGLPAGLSIDTATGIITGTIDRSASQGGTGGVYSVIVTARDAGGLAATQTFSWTVTNPAPVAANNTASTNEDTPIAAINVLGNDSDPDGDPLSVVSASAPNGIVTINPDGTLRYVPNTNFNGTDTITYTISDGQGGTATATVAVTIAAVNDAPVPVGTLPARANVDATTAISVATAAGFTDVDNATLSYSASGLPTGLSIDATTGVISGTIDRSASQGGTAGVYSVIVTARDAGGLTATQAFSWTVTNPAPTAANNTASTNEDTPIASINVLGNDSDPDGDPLTVTSASAPNGIVTINPDGTLRYVPNANFNGTDTITYIISDGQGGTATATVTVTIAAVNDAPVPVGALPARSNVDAAAGINVPTAGGFADVDNSALTYSAAGLPAGLSIDAVTGVISGTINRSASQGGAGGVYSVVVTARDAAGLTATQTFSWTVTNPSPIATNDTATTNEDTPVTIAVLPNDSDPDGDPLVVIAASATVGTATIAGNQVQYTPPANFNGTATITYTISDGQGGTSTATIIVTVNPVNDAPTATPIAPRNTADGATLSVPVAGSFSDVDGNPLSFSAAGLPPGLTINQATGVISGTIARDASQTGGGVYTATITASDGNGGTVTQTITFNVANPPPIATNDSVATAEDTAITISPLTNDTDPDGDPLTITSAAAQNGTVTINANGTVTYTPNPGYNGTDTITYTISDGNGGTATATITMAVADVNDAPVRSGSIGNQSNLDSQVINLPVAGAFSDPDGDTLTYTATGLPAGLTINATTGVISGTVDNSASQPNGGVYTIIITASDNRGGTATQTFGWTVTNPAPGAVNDVATTNEDTPVGIAVLTNDVDPDGDPLTVTAASAGNGTVTILPNGTLLYTPNANFNGTDTILYTISDSEGGVSTASVTVTIRPVNDAPTTVGLPSQNGDDGTAVTIPTASAFSDIDGDVLTFAATGLPNNLTIDPVTGVISGTLAPDTSQAGPYVVTITATDPSGRSVTTSFVYSVQNIPPVAVNDFASTPEDVPVVVAVLTNDSDPDNDPLTITSASANNGTVVVNPNGTLTFTPAPNFNGIATVSYTISDGNGGVATATLTINVAAVNDAPTALPIPNQASVDGAFYSAGVAPFFNDLDGDLLTFTATGLPAGLAIDSATGVISGTIDRNASQINGGVYTVTITANDGNGGTVSRTLTATVTNPAPTAANDSATTAEDIPIAAINVLGNDADPDGDPLIVTAASAANGTVTINPDGTLRYVPNANFNGTDTITYIISDGNGGTSTAAVIVTVTPVNDAPVAANDNATTNEDQPVTIGVSGNDSDVDGDSLTVTAATSPNGAVTINPDGTITFTPAANFNGATTITYTISDGNGGTTTATVNVTVNAVNDAPVANPSTASTTEDTSVNVPVLANDTDIDGNPLTVTTASAPNGTVVINPDGTVTYTPNRNFNGTDIITYTISDGQGGFSTATVTVTIGAVNDAPTSTPIAPRNNTDGAVISVPVAANFSDVDNTTLAFSATGLPAGLNIDAVTGIISGTIDRSASQPNGGVYSVTVTATDAGGLSSSQTFNWTVTNPPPVATNDTAITNEDTAVTLPVLANDSDPDGDPLAIINATAPNGTVAINPDGTITYTPNANFNGTDVISYTISDGNGGTSAALVTVTVNSINDAPTVDTPLPAQSGADNTPVNIPVAGNFSDLDRDTLSFIATGLPPGLSISAAGVITGTIDRAASQGGPNAGGIYTVLVTASDGRGGTVITTFTYTVTNPAPVATNDTATTPEDTAVTIPVLANDNDPDGDPLTITSATSPNGAVVINPDGTITFTPAPNFNGATTITYAISDSNGGTSTATVIVTVGLVNDAPVVGTPIANQSGVDNALVSIPVAGNVSDLDGDTLSFAASGLPAGLTINPTTGVISGTIDRSASQINGGVYTVTIIASDGNGGTVTSIFAYTVTNPGPAATNDSATTNEDTPVVISVLTNDADPDGDALTVTAATSPGGTVVINADGTITFTPNANFNGATTITYTISDRQGGSSTASVAVTVNDINDAPTADPPLSPQTHVDADTVNINVAPNFADLDGDTLTFTASGLPLGATINAAGIITGPLDNSASQGGPDGNGVYTVTVTASDGNGSTISSTFIWTVTNPAPVATNDTASTPEDTLVNITVLGNDSDADGDTLTVTSASAPNGTVVINPDGTLDYTPNANFTGTDVITYQISDGQGGTSTATVAVTVSAVNDAPTTVGLPNLFDSNGEQIVAIPVAPAFADLDNATLTYSATGLTALGLSIDPITGVISGTIPATASSAVPGGAYTIVITATDAGGLSVSTSFTWTITNEPPRAIDNNYVGVEDTPLVLDVLTNDIDPDGDPATPIQITSVVANNGTATINPDGTISFTPDANFNGTATVTYTIQDANGSFATAVATIVIAAVNDAPLVVPLPDRTNGDSDVINIPAGAQFSDREGNPLSFSAAGLPLGLSIDAATGAITGIIDPSASQANGGFYTVTITADDGNGGITSISFDWQITNPGPTATNDVANTTEDVAVTILVLGNDNDPDNDPLRVTTASAPNGIVVINADGTITYTPDTNFNGTDTITYTISDGNGGTSTAIVTVTVAAANDAPTVQPLPARSNVDATALTGPTAINVSSNFADLDGDALSFTATGLPLGLTISSAGVISGTIDPAASQGGAGGIYTVTITASDGNGGTLSTSFSWTVTNPPPVAANDNATTPEDTPIDLSVLSNDSDPDGDALTVTTASAGNGSVTIGAGGVLTYTPNANFNGTDTITYSISDGNGGTATATVTIIVGALNDAPVSAPLAPRTNPDGAIVAVPVAANFSDVDNPILAFSATGLPAGLAIDPVTGIISGAIDRNASQPNGGVYAVTVTATDASGLTTSQTFSWSVTNPPPIAINDEASTAEDFPVNINVLANDSDADGDTLAVTTASAGNGTVVIRPDGTIDYTPAPDFNGTDIITYTISDGNGGTATATVSVIVGAQNDPPVAVNDAASTNEDTPVTVSVLANDSDVDGNPLTVTTASSPNGTVVINADGTITFTPATNFNGLATISYTISDGQGGTATATVTVDVNPVNDLPVAANDQANTVEDTPVTVAVLANDSDVDGNPLTVTAATSPDGQVTINPNGTVTFMPNPNFNGTTTVTYTISDGNGGTSTATVTLTVAAVNDVPVANPSSATTDEDVPLTLTPLANDSDADGNALMVTAVSAQNGIVTINADGTVGYVPNPNFNGTDVVTYTISDGQGGTATSTITVIVNSVNDVPVAANDSVTTPEDGPVTIAVLANDTDADGNPLTITAASSPNGAVVINADGTISFTPNPNFNGPATITYTISDGQGGTATATVSVNVTPVNDAPVAQPDIATTPEDTPVVIAPLANDSDVDGNPLTIIAASSPGGTVVINPNGTITFTPNPNFNGPTTITYAISDGQGGTTFATINVNVTAVNDPPVARPDVFTMDEYTTAAIPVLSNDNDVDGNPLTITAASSPNGTVIINADGTISFTPNPNFNGPTTITYTISDGQGGTATATVSVNVTPVNDTPVAQPDIATTPEDTPVVIAPLANDSDVDGNPLTIIAASSPGGTVVINPNGTITFTPNPNFNGPTTITYAISDGQGGTTFATINVNVTAVNDPPVARPDVFTMDEDTTAAIPVLSNDNDVDGNPLTITAASSPNGTVVINADGTISFTPNPNFNGPATITYTISDGQGGTATATVSINVRNTNELPVDGDEAIRTIGGVVTPINVLANATDPEGDPLSVFFAEVESGQGSVVINADGTISYTAPQGFQGIAIIRYIISDGKGGFDLSFVTVNVTQAAADINALVGNNADSVPPNGWLVDTIRDQSNAYINAPYPILDAVNAFRSLNGTPDLNTNRPLLNAINGISWLRGTGELDADGHPVSEVVGYIDRIRDLRFGADRLFDPRFGDFVEKSLTGFSVRELTTGNNQLMIESVVRDRVIYMEVRDIGAEGDPRITEYQLRVRGGGALPEWIHMDKRGLAIVERPVDAEDIHLIVRAIRADGKIIEIPVLIQGATGEIQLDGNVKETGKISAAPLGDTLKLAQSAAADETAQLLAAFRT
jgi:large repetitive protein